MQHDETLLGVSEKVKNFAIVCASTQTSSVCLKTHVPPSDTCDITKVPDFTKVRKPFEAHGLADVLTPALRCTSSTIPARQCKSSCTPSSPRRSSSVPVCRFFYRNKHIMIDLGTGNNNKINWPIEDKQELIDIVETVYRGSSKGRGLVISPKGESFVVRLVYALN